MNLKVESKLFFIALVLQLISCHKKEGNEISSENDEQKLNVILFVSDDHGTDALGCYGNPIIKTPNFDQLALEGFLFTNAYCTSASCAASRSVILSGKFGHATGSYGHVHDYHHFSSYESLRSLPVLLKEKGYETTRIGKYHLAPESVYKFDRILKEDPRNTFKMAETCKEVFKSKSPFFLYFCTDDPHRGMPFKPEKWNEPNNFGNRIEGYEGVNEVVYDPKEVIVPSFLSDNRETREELAQYYQSVSRIDQGLGRLVSLLKENGKYDNTIIIYISDNGIAFPGAKTTVYEPGIKLPCIVRHPKVSSVNKIIDRRVSWVDLTPTILDMVSDESINEDFHGTSFYPLLIEDKMKSDNVVFAAHNFHEITMYYPMRAFLQGEYKLIVNFAWPLEYPFASDLWSASSWQASYRSDSKRLGKRKIEDYLYRSKFELYKLSSDPNELNNLAEKKEYQEVLHEMINSIKSFQRKTNDPWFILWDHDASIQGSGVNL